ncbi:MAG: DUF3179 domain-containing protein [Candidatus Nanohaloarchaea archaeon]|nr:DUF3179 domain-containing protein [Candidatus Nanohaloarchaea archaeon]
MDVPDSLYISIVAAFFLISLVGMAFLGTPEGAADAVNATGLFGEAGERTPVRPDGFQTICLGSGCVPSIDDPSYTSVFNAGWLDRGDDVISVSVGGEHYAFPLRVLRLHGVVNTRLGGKPVAVTYSPHSGTPVVVSRRVGGDVLQFEHSGKLYNGNMVMRDRETGTMWSQFLSEGLKGELAGTQLQTLDSQVVRWGIWRDNHPTGRVLSRDTGIYGTERYMDTPYFAYRLSRDVPFHQFQSDTHPKAVVYGTVVDGSAAAYRDAHVKARDLVQDEVGGEPVMLVQDEDRDWILGFRREVNGSETTFRLEDGELVDDRTGSTWTLAGKAVGGPMEGARLPRLELRRSYWFTWKLFYPETELYSVRG